MALLPVVVKKVRCAAQWSALQELGLAPGLAQVRAKFAQHSRQFVKVLAAVLDHDLAAVETARAEALEADLAAGDVP